MPGVRFETVRPSLASRAVLTARVRGALEQREFEEAGTAITDQLAAAESALRIDKIFCEWGLLGVEGLEIDGRPATPEALIQDGPLELCREIAEAIRRDCHLGEDERKN